MANFESYRDRVIMDDRDVNSDSLNDPQRSVSFDSQDHNTLLDHIKAMVKQSRITSSNHFDAWDYNDLIFRSRRIIDKEDRSAMLKGNTAKMIVPLTYSQVMTFVAFCVQTLQQNKRFWTLEEVNSRFNPLREPIELVLERDIRRNGWNAFLVQFFLDVARFSVGAAEVCYDEEYKYMKMPKTQPVQGPFGTNATQTTYDYQPICTFEGNRVRPVSPYRFLPDYRIPLERYQQGDFCGSEEMWTMSSLRGCSLDLFNLDFIPKLTVREFDDRKMVSRVDEIPVRQNNNMGDGGQMSPDAYMKSGTVIVTKMVADIIPNEFTVKGKKVLGNQKFPLRYVVWYANDKTVIRFEEANYLHGMFPYICAQYIPDQHKPINEGLSDVCDQITEYITWLANTHKASQANALESKWIVDPTGIDIKTLESRSPYIFTKRSAANMGVDRYIKQFITQDVTSGTPQEIQIFKELLEAVTGNSAFMQGQSSPGRRSATQDQVVTQGAAARAKTTLSTIWDGAFVPLGRQFLANNRQEMTLERFIDIVGDRPCGNKINPQTQQYWTTQEVFQLFQGDPQQIATDEAFFIFDGTSPAEKSYLAQSLQEVFIEMLQNPVISQVMGYGPAELRQLFDDIYNLRGVTNARLPSPQAPIQQPPAPPGAPQLPPGAEPAALNAPPSVSNG